MNWEPAPHLISTSDGEVEAPNRQTMKKLISILLVDDDKAANFINELLIRKHNLAEVLYTARNGKEAIELIREKCLNAEGEANHLPQLILLDINMPVLDGFGFLKAFEELDCPAKSSSVIAVLTTSTNPKDQERIKSAGITNFLNKPLTKDVLDSLLQRHFG